MNSNKKIVVGIIGVVAFMYAVFSFSSFFAPVPTACTLEEGCPHEQQLKTLEAVIPLLVSIAVVVGAGGYYLMTSRIESKTVSLKKNAEILLKFLNEDEKKLVNALIESKGKVLQAEITRLPGMTKLKSHRVVQKLVDKGVIEKEQVGKTNIVKFTKEIREGLVD